ncbi:MBL fold metallo-hydrolase [Halosquirtibacter xylanolyticus]|uniref:MBL fold metallo-hydrolase n=1 Tax=Halosquirtibacter xylanolyticus TaxID=3374599 RepID=UPI00374916A7|nr:MBL fold metallo-hydrolase [Prolixibacteraceae bacterium]
MNQKSIKKYPIHITLYRNATMRIEHFGINILTDPMLSDKGSFMSFVVPDKKNNPTTDLPVPIEKILEDIDVVLISHLHPDKFDQKAMELIPKNKPIICVYEDSIILREMGFRNVHTINDTLKWKDVTIHRQDASQGEHEIEDQLGKVTGFIIEAPGYDTLYWVGDSILDNDVRKNIHRTKPEIIITHSGGALHLGEHQILMNSDDTVEIARQAPEAKVVAVHLDALDHCLETRESLKQRVKEAKIHNIFIPLDGQRLTL